MKFGLYLHPIGMRGMQSLRVPTIGRPSLLIVRTDRIVTQLRTVGYSGIPAYSRE